MAKDKQDVFSRRNVLETAACEVITNWHLERKVQTGGIWSQRDNAGVWFQNFSWNPRMLAACCLPHGYLYFDCSRRTNCCRPQDISGGGTVNRDISATCVSNSIPLQADIQLELHWCSTVPWSSWFTSDTSPLKTPGRQKPGFQRNLDAKDQEVSSRTLDILQ